MAAALTAVAKLPASHNRQMSRTQVKACDFEDAIASSLSQFMNLLLKLTWTCRSKERSMQQLNSKQLRWSYTSKGVNK